MNRPKDRECGFTLIEVIITIVIAAMAAGVAFTMAGGTVTRSVEPVLAIQSLALTKQPGEELGITYKQYLRDDIDWSTFVNTAQSMGASANITVTDVTSTMGTDFTVWQVTVTGNQGQSLTTYFSE